jgi:hypothetical protein
MVSEHSPVIDQVTTLTLRARREKLHICVIPPRAMISDP